MGPLEIVLPSHRDAPPPLFVRTCNLLEEVHSIEKDIVVSSDSSSGRMEAVGRKRGMESCLVEILRWDIHIFHPEKYPIHPTMYRNNGVSYFQRNILKCKCFHLTFHPDDYILKGRKRELRSKRAANKNGSCTGNG